MYAPSRVPDSMVQSGPMNAGPIVSTSGAISVPSPTQTPSATWNPGMSSCTIWSSASLCTLR